MKNIINNMKSKLNSDRGDTNTISQILWIAMAVVLVITIGGLVFNAVKQKGDQVAECINNSNSIISGKTSSACAG